MNHKKLEPFNDVLLLNADYNAISIIKWRRAVVLLLKNKVKFISKRVVCLRNYIKIPYKKLLSLKPTKNLVKKLGNYACAYCGSYLDLTVDHLIPTSRGGEHSFENMVCACRSCNEKKGDRTPLEWGRLPYLPAYKPFSKLEIIVRQSNVSEWKQYIYT
jgi:5-methylcytosine-specific restriction endonuclease McrA